MHSAIYEGRVRHRRESPVIHAFSNRLFMMYLDLNELPSLFDQKMLWSNEGRAIARFRRSDHLKGIGSSEDDLQVAARHLIRERTGVATHGPIRLLTHLEYFRYRFNPVSFYFCFDESDQRLEVIIAEINNTPWGEQHCYVLDYRTSGDTPRQQQFEFSKEFHISPFAGMDTEYRWTFTLKDRLLAIHMENRESGQRYLSTAMKLERKELCHASMNMFLLRYPLMTLSVIVSIYWHAFRLWMKRCPAFSHPRHLSASQEGTHPC